MSTFELTEDELQQLRSTANMVGLTASLLASIPNASAENDQWYALTNHVEQIVSGVLDDVEQRFTSVKILPKVHGVSGHDLAEIIELLSGQRYSNPSRWLEIDAALGAACSADPNALPIARAWKKICDANLTESSRKFSEPIRFAHIAHDAWRSPRKCEGAVR